MKVLQDLGGVATPSFPYLHFSIALDVDGRNKLVQVLEVVVQAG